MGNISIKLNLTKLKHVVREMNGKHGKKLKCLVLPLEENNFFEGEKGVYIDITAIEVKNKRPDSKDTHLLKQNLPKELYEIMSDQEKEAMPILGNAIDWSKRATEPNTSSSFSESAVDKYEEELDDLPF